MSVKKAKRAVGRAHNAFREPVSTLHPVGCHAKQQALARASRFLSRGGLFFAGW